MPPEPVAQLRAAVASAFSARPHPGGDAIAHRHPQYPTSENNRAADFFAARRWEAVTLDALRSAFKGQYPSMIFTLMPAAFDYFLPAFLVTALDFEHALEMSDALSTALTDSHDQPGFSEWFHERVDALSPAERGAVTAVLRHLADQYAAARFTDNPAHRALESYWATSGGGRTTDEVM